SEAVFEESLLAEANAEKANSTGYLSCPSCFIVSNMKSPVKALSWQQAAKDYAEHCHAEIHLINEGHMMYTKIPDQIVGIFKTFLQKIDL
ncbi:MAG: alpha/beta hydrolase, partial [Oscillospiraceae bacterium]|nr:alpha/beta hydrolase [Oscillospiraceae bacterium]